MACEECLRRERIGLRNRELRRELNELHKHADKTFFEMCREKAVGGTLAEQALGELWGSGEFDCGPEDNEWMVERCLEAVREYNESRKNPADSAVTATTLCE